MNVQSAQFQPAHASGEVLTVGMGDLKVTANPDGELVTHALGSPDQGERKRTVDELMEIFDRFGRFAK